MVRHRPEPQIVPAPGVVGSSRSSSGTSKGQRRRMTLPVTSDAASEAR